jgi:cobyrinic acid a,c-diamide synthase
LVQAGEHADLAALMTQLAATAQNHINLNALLIAARTLAVSADTNRAPALPPPGQRIALASDRAFTFAYPHLLQAWRDAGAEILPFSPLGDEPPPAHADSCWLPGGYPELHADALAAADNFKNGLRSFAATRPVHGECGGYMMLGQTLEDANGKQHAMAGLLGHATSFAKRKLHLGYRTARLLSDGVLGNKGATVRGHEFHYASLTATGDDESFAELSEGEGKELGPSGGRRGRVSGSFFHAIAAA